MKILITGGNGMVARAAAAHCRTIGDETFAFTRAKLDIADAAAVCSVLEDIRPDAILNCAAFTNVDAAETEPERARFANVDGVRNLASVAAEIGSCFITISTDYVFDGTYSGFYTQEFEPNPLGVYAKTKREGELAAIAANPDSVVVRSGWIYGPGGTNFLSVLPELLSKGQPIRAICDSYGTPTYALDLAARLRKLAGLRRAGIFHVTNEGPGTSYAGFAKKLCEIAGFDTRLVEDVSKDQIKRPAPRPASSKLACLLSKEVGLAPMPDWENAVKRFVDIRNAS